MDQTFEYIGINNPKQLKKFYSQWSVNASKLIKKYAEEHSIEWFNTRWKKRSKEIPFRIRLKAPRSFKGNVWFSSSPVNYSYAVDAKNFTAKLKKIPKKVKRKPVNVNGVWITPKTYSPTVSNVDQSEISKGSQNGERYWLSKTSHNKTRKYKKPLLWTKIAGDVIPVELKDQLSDKLFTSGALDGLIDQAFKQTVDAGRYL